MADDLICAYGPCSRPLPTPDPRALVARRYCSPSHKNLAYRQRQLSGGWRRNRHHGDRLLPPPPDPVECWYCGAQPGQLCAIGCVADDYGDEDEYDAEHGRIEYDDEPPPRSPRREPVRQMPHEPACDYCLAAGDQLHAVNCRSRSLEERRRLMADANLAPITMITADLGQVHVPADDQVAREPAGFVPTAPVSPSTSPSAFLASLAPSASYR